MLNNSDITIVFFGTSSFAIPALEKLIESKYHIAAVFTAPDKPKGRKLNMFRSPVTEYIISHLSQFAKTHLLMPHTINSDTFKTLFYIKPDIGIMVSYGKILPQKLIDLFPLGILNIHPSLLPRYRGASPIQSTIINGDKETGVTIILTDSKMDHGPILAKQEFSNKLRYQELYNELAKLGAQLLIETLPKWVAGEVTPTPQDDTEATYTKPLKKEDGKIDWSKSAEEIERMVRALNPWPGTYTYFQNKIFKIKRVHVIPLARKLSPGTIFIENGAPIVACGSHALVLITVQWEGKKETFGENFLRGHADFVSTQFTSH